MQKPNRPRFDKKAASASPLSGPVKSSQIPSDPEKLAAVRRFVAQVGGFDKAHGALELLAILTAAQGPKSAP